MSLVLALGVQGIADAITDPKLKQSSSEFFKFRVPNQTFRISFTLSFSETTTNESITIDFSDDITPIGVFQGEAEGADITLTETNAAGDDNVLSGDRFKFGTPTKLVSRSLTIEGRFDNAEYGIKTVKIGGSGSGWTEGNTDTGQSYTYYYFVSNANGVSTNSIPLSTTIGTFSPFVAGQNSGYATGVFGGSTSEIFAGESTDNLPVLYTNRSRLQMSHPNYKSDELVTLPSSGPIASNFTIHLRDNTSTDVVTTQVRGPDTPIVTGVYIYGYPTLEVDGLTKSEKGGMENPGKPGEVIANAFTATVKDQKGSAVPGVPVTFTRTAGPGTLVFGSGNTGTFVQANNDLISSNGNPVNAGSGTTLYVRTNSSGKASVNFRLGDGESTVTVDAVAATQVTVKAHGGSAAGKELSVLRTREGLENNTFDLYALVTYDGKPVDVAGTLPPNTVATDFDVIFRTDDGTLTNTSSATPDTGPEVKETPNSDGVAEVEFKWDGSSSNPQVTASLEEPIPGVTGVTRDVQTITFDITSSSSPPPPPPPPPQTTNRLTISTTGEGLTRSVTVNALTAANVSVPGLSVLLSGTALTTPQTVTTGTAVTITLPSTPDTYTLIATDPNGTFDLATINITVSAPGTLAIRTVGTRSGTQQSITVTASGGTIPSGGLLVTLHGVALPRTVIIPSGQTSVSRSVTLPSATSAHTVYASAPGFSDSPTITIPVPGTTPDTTPDTTGPIGAADSIEIAGSRQLSGTVNQVMRLRARVLDANNNGVSNVRVTFRVLAPGRGRLSQVGNGRGIRVNTDRTGYASASLMPLGEGNLIVEAKAAGVTAAVSFIIAVGEAAAPSTDDTTPGPGVTPSREINPDVHVRAAQRPPMLWVDGGKIYALVGADVEEFGSGVEGAMNIAVGGGKVYWTEMTGESSGTINSAKLDGSGVKELKKIKAVPMGIAVDTAGDKLYWTNSRGRIQSADLDGSGIENVMLDLPGPMDIAVARGNLYWTQYDETDGEGNVGIANATGRGTPKYISTGADAPGSIAIGGNKVYWTEMTGSNAGTINSASLNGSGAEELNDIRAVPMGIGVDTARSKLYWTNSRGRVQSANLEGRKIESVVDGLGTCRVTWC